MKTRPARRVLLALVILGAVGLSAGSIRDINASLPAEMKGLIWTGMDREGRILIKESSRYPPLDPGETIRVLEADGKDLFFREFSFNAIRETKQASIEVGFHDTRGRSILLTVAPKSRGGIRLFVVGARGQRVPVAGKRDREYLGDLSRPLNVKLLMGDRKFTVEINGEALLQTREILRSGGFFTLTAEGGSSRIRKLQVEAVKRNEGRGLQSVSYYEELSSLPSTSAWPRILEFFFRACLALLVLLLYLRILCRGRPGFKNLLHAGMLLLAPSSVYFATGLFRPVSPHSLFLLFLFPAGLVPALYSLREYLGTEGPVRRIEKVRACLVAAMMIAVVAGTAWTYANRLFEQDVEAERAAQERGDAAALVMDQPRRLGLHNAWAVDRTYRNMALKAPVVLEEGAILQVRIRAGDATQALGVSLFLSADPRFETRFFLETLDRFEAIGRGSGALQTNKPFSLTIEARGRSFNAYVNGMNVASAKTRLYPEGGAVLLAAKGSAIVRRLEVKPVAQQEIKASLLPDQVLWVSSPLAFLLFYTLLASLLMAESFRLVLEASSFGLLPIAYAFHLASPAAPFDAHLGAWSLCMAGMLLVACLASRIHRLNRLKVFILLLVILTGIIWAGAGMAERAQPGSSERINRMTITDWSGGRLEEDFLHFQHPLYRRWNGYLARHGLAGRAHGLIKKDGRIRILCLGTSSTLGRGVKVPYPLHLEKLLKAAGIDAEVMNGAVQGANGLQQYHFLKNVLLGFSPDIVTLSLYRSDLVRFLRTDEAAYIKKVSAPSHERSFFDVLRERAAKWVNPVFHEGIGQEGGPQVEPIPDDEGDEAPQAMYEALLRSFAALAAEHDIRMVFIKEPVAGGEDRTRMKAFYETMERVGKESGIPVVDPRPLLKASGGTRLFMDRVHPSEEGHAVIAEALLPVIRE